jgi:hypothetical protein
MHDALKAICYGNIEHPCKLGDNGYVTNIWVLAEI